MALYIKSVISLFGSDVKMLGNLLGGFITVLVGVNLIGTIADSIVKTSRGSTTSGGANVTGTAYTILSLTTIFFALGIMTAGVGIAVNGLRNAGIM